jgi:hypothetical protein
MKSWIARLSSSTEWKTTLEAPLGQEGEPAFGCIELRGRSRSEMENETRVAREPFQDLGMLVGRVVVDNDMDCQSCGCSGVDDVEEADELLMAMTLHALADHLPFDNVEGGKQGRGAMPFVVVHHRAGAPLLHRQAWLSTVDRLDLAFLIDSQNDGMVGRIGVKPDDVAQFGANCGSLDSLN